MTLNERSTFPPWPVIVVTALAYSITLGKQGHAMNSKERIDSVLANRPADRPAVMPIAHTALARAQSVPLGRYFTDAATMARVIADGAKTFGFDGVQLSMGVTGEAEALGADVEQPADGAPLIKQHPLKDSGAVGSLRADDAVTGGRMPMYHAAVARVVAEIGDEVFVMSTLRGPLNIASQLRGVEDVLVDMVENPEAVETLLDFATETAIRCSQASLEAGAHAVMFGEATCSPNFISPAMYRQFVQPRHRRLIDALRDQGWRDGRYTGLHVCGNILPILDDLIATGVDLLDIDYQVPAAEAIARSGGRLALRGNLDPVADLLHGEPGHIRRRVEALTAEIAGTRWIISSGCDIPPGTAADNLAALVHL